MAKRKKAIRKTVTKAVGTEPQIKEIEVRADLDVLRGRFANHIQVSLQEEEFILDFFARAGEKGSLLSRVFITPQHAKRLADLLKRQVTMHKKRFKNSPLAAGTAKRKSR